MNFLLACALLVCSAAFASARQAAICFASEDQIKEQAACVRDQAGEFNARLDDAVANLGCTDDFCAVQKLCTFVSTDRALMALFARPEATLLRDLSLRCTAAAALVGTPSAALPGAALTGAALPVAAVGPAFLAPQPAFFAPRALGPRPFGARAFGVGAFRPAPLGFW
uniref:Saposin B-type domain-containing protein n=1 Tax=Amblyomma maculatum TaxID=34609 RepID=G3MMS2_AMBMU